MWRVQRRRMLTAGDRIEISTGLKAGWSIRAIAEQLGRSPSVISREVRRNSTLTLGYRMVSADVRAERRRARPQVGKIAADEVLAARVLTDLKRGRSPRQIAGRLRAEAREDEPLQVAPGSPGGHDRVVSHEAVYSYVYAMPRGKLKELGIRLDSGRTRRRRRKPLGERTTGPIVGMVSIDDRPDDVLARKVPGDWEGDLIIGKGGQSAAATLVERVTRFTCIIALPLGKTSDGVADAVIDQVHALPDLFRRSLTWDQGSEMARHAHITAATFMPVYFAHPHSPWERGSNENRNRVIRRYLPKSTQITTHQPYLDAIADEINELPMERLGWLTPREAYERLLAGQPLPGASTP